MATAFSHAWIGGLLGSAGPREIPLWQRAALPATLAVVPDLDVVAFSLDISYGHPLGHRGFSHSILFALLVAPLAVRICMPALPSFGRAWWIMVGLSALACASHGVLDAMTDAGKGVGFFLPFDTTRYFFPFRPLATSPIGIGSFFERAGPILHNEWRWLVLPSLVFWVAGGGLRRLLRRRQQAT